MSSATLSVSASVPPGWKFTTLSSPDISSTPSVAFGKLPVVVTSDLVIFREYATNNNVTSSYSVTVSTNGVPTIFSGSDSSSLSFLYFFWDESLSAYGSTYTYNTSHSLFLRSVQNLWEWVYEAQSLTGGSISKRMKNFLSNKGYTGGINTALFRYLRSLGYTGTLTNMINLFERDYTVQHGPVEVIIPE